MSLKTNAALYFPPTAMVPLALVEYGRHAVPLVSCVAIPSLLIWPSFRLPLVVSGPLLSESGVRISSYRRTLMGRIRTIALYIGVR